MLSRFTTRISRPVTREFSGIAVTNVSRIARFNVGNEENAVKADAIVEGLKSTIAAQAGFSQLQRKCCKAEWDYELTTIFDSLDSFKGYMGNEEVQATYNAALEELKGVSETD